MISGVECKYYSSLYIGFVKRMCFDVVRCSGGLCCLDGVCLASKPQRIDCRVWGKSACFSLRSKDTKLHCNRSV